jgi:hypothetical protein
MIDVESRAVAVLEKWFAAGWASVFARLGIEPDFSAPVEGLRDSLLQPLAPFSRDDPLVADLAPDACAALCPNDPAKSIIYHMWACAHPSRGLARPSLEDLDVLENFIYKLGEHEPLPDGPLRPMVLAYAYRNRAATAHGIHADMVYSRVAITRVGNAFKSISASPPDVCAGTSIRTSVTNGAHVMSSESGTLAPLTSITRLNLSPRK